MPETNLRKKWMFQILRYVPDPFLQEFINIGIVLYEAEVEHPRVAVRVTRDWSRVLSLDPCAPIGILEQTAENIEKIAQSGSVTEIRDFINEFCGAVITSEVLMTSPRGHLGVRTLEEEVAAFMMMYVERRAPTAIHSDLVDEAEDPPVSR